MPADVGVAVPNRYNYIISTSTNVPLPVEGLQKLVQIITISIKTAPGRDLFSPEYGMGLRQILPVSVTANSEQDSLSEVAQGLLKIQEQIVKEQSSEDLTTYEQLQSLELIKLELDIERGLWDVTVRVTSVAGVSARVTVEI